MNWDKFRETIDQKINLKTRLKSPNDIEDAVLNYTKIIKSAAWNSSVTTIKYDSNSLSISTHIRELIVQKRRARL